VDFVGHGFDQGDQEGLYQPAMIITHWPICGARWS
jgi:hypothetical protein